MVVASVGRRRSSIMKKRTLLITFDAFDTLFHPSQPIASQYISAANSYGLTFIAAGPNERVRLDQQALSVAFRRAFQEQMLNHPNYGREEVLRGSYAGPRQWWKEVITATFAGYLARVQTEEAPSPTEQGSRFRLPEPFLESLLERFASRQGYALFEDVVPFLDRVKRLRRQLASASPEMSGDSGDSKTKQNYAAAAFAGNLYDNNSCETAHQQAQRPFDRILLGVLSNSDDRVPSVLRSFGLRIGDVRADQDVSSLELPGFEQRHGRYKNNNSSGYDGLPPSFVTRFDPDNDFDMVITSYEAGAEKPSRAIFDVARRQAKLLLPRYDESDANDYCQNQQLVAIHVGDDPIKDCEGAANAGWDGYLLTRDKPGRADTKTITSLLDLLHLIDTR